MPYRVEMRLEGGYRISGPDVVGINDVMTMRDGGMLKQDAQKLADMLNRAYHAGISDTKKMMRIALGINAR